MKTILGVSSRFARAALAALLIGTAVFSSPPAASGLPETGSASASANGPADLSGYWEGTFTSSRGGTIFANANLRQEGNSLSGGISAGPRLTGSRQGDKIHLQSISGGEHHSYLGTVHQDGRRISLSYRLTYPDGRVFIGFYHLSR